MHKKIFFILVIIVSLAGTVFLFARGGMVDTSPAGFDDLWHQADSLKEAGQPAAAMKIVAVIRKKAEKEQNQPVLVKAVLYGESLRSTFEEDYLVKSIHELEKIFSKVGSPAAQIIQSALGELYMGYYHANRYELLQRTTTEIEGGAIETWDAARVLAKADGCFRASLGNVQLLKSTPASDYAMIFESDSLIHNPLPTLFDVLNHRVLEHFTSDEGTQTKAGRPFVLQQPHWLLPAKSFVTTQAGDTTIRENYLIERFRDAIAFHLNDKDPSALIDIDLRRIAYVYEKLDLVERDSLYLSALQSLESRYRNFGGSTRVTHQIANYYSSRAGALTEENPQQADRFFALALEKTTQALSLFPDSKGARDCRVLAASIEQPALFLSADEAVLPSTHFELSIRSKNIDTLWFKLLPLKLADLEELQQSSDDSLIHRLARRKPLKSWSMNLSAPYSYLVYSQKRRVDPLDQGAYLIVAGQDKGFDITGKVLATSVVQVTNIAWIAPSPSIDQPRLLVVDRRTGFPLKGVKTKVRYSRYDYASRRHQYSERQALPSNQHGEVLLDGIDRGSILLSFAQNSDVYVPMNGEWFSQQTPAVQQPVQRTWIFTDRAIYRPGQQVWFKGIVMHGVQGKFSAVDGAKVRVMLYNVNNQLVEQMDAVSNEFGSISGSFVLPSAGLAGNYRIATGSGGASFKVESYKRPVFAVTLHQPAEAYQPGDRVAVTGKAEAYAGFAVSGARVSYTVSRSEFSWWWRGWFPRNAEVIATGDTVTNDDGSFALQFRSTGYPENLEGAPTDYEYTVKATVTDQAGESHSESLSVRVSRKSLFINVSVEPMVNLHDMKPVKLATVNIAGKPVASGIGISLYRLVQPDSIYWPNSNGNNRYSDVSSLQFTDWPLGALMAEFEINYMADSVVDLKKYIRQPGVYALKIKATDKQGHLAEQTTSFTVFDPASSELPIRTPDWVVQLDQVVKEGEAARFLFGSSEKDARYLVQVCTENGVVSEKWLDAGGGQRLFSQPAAAAMNGSFQVHFVMVRNNRFFSHSFRVLISQPEKTLVAKLSTFRNRTEPGAREHWTVSVADGNGKPIQAEVLASMYDASLDAFASYSMTMNLARTPWSGSGWQSGAFRVSQARIEYNDTNRFVFKAEPGYTSLNWFGYQFYNVFRRYKGGEVLEYSMVSARTTTMADKRESEVEASVDEAVAGQPPMNDAELVEDEGAGLSGPEVTVPLRTNLNETAFFYPFLKTDTTGTVGFDFVMPDALTRWKFMALAHTKNGLSGSDYQLITSSRELMVVPSLPRFVRVGDSLSLPVSVINLSDKSLVIQVEMKLSDVVSRKPLAWAGSLLPVTVEIPAGATRVVEWPLLFDGDPGLISYEVAARSGNQRDGQAGYLPVLSDRIRLISTKAFTLRGKETSITPLNQLFEPSSVKSDDQLKLTIEYVSNPAWYVVQALPALKTPDQHCISDILFRYYAASMGRLVIETYPDIRSAIGEWSHDKNTDTSPLSLNDDLKYLGLEATPWVGAARDESVNHRRLVDFYNENNLNQFEKESIGLLAGFQMSGGGFVWYKGMPESRYLTGQVVETIGRMVKMGAVNLENNGAVYNMMKKAVGYLDEEMLTDYQRLLLTAGKTRPEPDASQLHYLYVRSYFFDRFPVAGKYREAFRFYQEGISVKGTGAMPMLQAMTALALHRAGDAKNAERMMASLADKALTDKEGNLFWRREYGQRWYDAPLETQVVVVEAWNELRSGSPDIDKMRGWLLSRKRTEAWESQPATAAACYAFLLQGDRRLPETNPVQILVNGVSVSVPESGLRSGYFRKEFQFSPKEAASASVQFAGQGNGTGWGGVYLQYYSRQEKVNEAGSGFTVGREVFRMVGDKGVRLVKGERLTRGDRLKVTLTVKADRDMEFVTLRDLRAAGLEPVHVISGYEWRDGAGYYKVTGDATVDYFFYQLRKGVYVFDYEVNVTRNGDFSDGPATIQSQYAPAFTGRSQGNRLEI